jgi:hypothetical protein
MGDSDAVEQPGGKSAGKLRGQFRGRYFTIGVVNLLIGGALFAGDGFVFIYLLGKSGSAGIAYRGVPIDWLIRLCFGVVSDGLSVVGTIGSFWRAGWSRRVIIAGLFGQLLVLGASVATGIVDSLQMTHGIHLTVDPVVFGVMIARVFYAVLFYVAYRDMRGDFYFRDAEMKPAMREPGFVAAIGAVQLQKFNYPVRGMEVASGNEVEFTSKAATRELALKTATAMGLDLKTVVVEEIGSA